MKDDASLWNAPSGRCVLRNEIGDPIIRKIAKLLDAEAKGSQHIAPGSQTILELTTALQTMLWITAAPEQEEEAGGSSGAST
jgi:hypothetical protein